MVLMAWMAEAHCKRTMFVCLLGPFLGLVIAKAHWSSNLVCLSPVSTTAITAATMGAGGGVFAALESHCTSSYFA